MILLTIYTTNIPSTITRAHVQGVQNDGGRDGAVHVIVITSFVCGAAIQGVLPSRGHAMAPMTGVPIGGSSVFGTMRLVGVVVVIATGPVGEISTAADDEAVPFVADGKRTVLCKGDVNNTCFCCVGTITPIEDA